MTNEPTIWIARDSDGSLVMYQNEPTYNESSGDWEPNGDDPTVEFVELGPMKWPDIEPACCVMFEQKIHYRQKFVCPSCKGTGTVYVDFEHPQWVRCGTPFVNCGKCGSQDTRLVYPAIEESHPECPHCGREFDPPPIVDGERYPPVFARHVCDCGYNFESERVVRYISRPMEERK